MLAEYGVKCAWLPHFETTEGTLVTFCALKKIETFLTEIKQVKTQSFAESGPQDRAAFEQNHL